jgi:hypothetical protein
MDWAGRGCIKFQGSNLPHYAKYFYVCIPPSTLPEEIHDWTFDLRYCWGRQRKAPSTFVHKACDVLEQYIYANREGMFRHLLTLRPDCNPGEVCQELLQAINTMRAHAERTDICEWIMEPEEGEIEDALVSCLAILRDMERAQHKCVLSEEQELQLLTASDATKISFVNDVTDELSDNTTNPD